MPRFVAVLAVVWTVLLSLIAWELYPLSQAARVANSVAEGFAKGWAARATAPQETDAARRERLLDEAVEAFTFGLEAGARSGRTLRPSPK